jgi:hypothetical protein
MQRLGEASADLLAKVAVGLRDQCDLAGLPERERHGVWLDTHLVSISGRNPPRLLPWDGELPAALPA